MMGNRFATWIGLGLFIVAHFTEPSSTLGQDGNAELLPGSFVARQDLSFIFASTNRTIPGIGFHLQTTSQQEINGVVVDERNAPVAGAEIWLSGFYGRIPLRERTTSKEDGTFDVKLPIDAGLGKVQWSYYAVHQNLAGTHSAFVDGRLQFTMSLGRRLTVRAVEELDGKPTDKPLRDFFLHLQDGRIIPSDPMGNCDVSGLIPEVQYVLATAPGHTPYVAMMDFYEDRDVELKIPLRKGGQVSGQVLDDEDRLLPFNPVYSWTCEHSLFTVGHGVSDAQGHYELAGIAIGRPVRVSAFSHHDGDAMYRKGESITIRSSEEPKTIDFQVTPRRVAAPNGNAVPAALPRNIPNGLARGIVRLPDGKPCPEFKLRVQGSTKQPLLGGWAASYGSIGISFSNPQGTFLFSGVPANSPFRAIISADGYCDAVLDPVVSMESESTEELDLHEFILKPAAQPQISVIGTDGNEIKDAIVELYRADPGNWIQPYQRGRHVAIGTTDQDGKVVLTPSPIESGRAMVIAKGFGEQQFDWTDGTDMIFQLQPIASLSIQIRIDQAPQKAIEFSLNDEFRGVSFKSGKLRFSEGIALWELPEILPGQYKIVGNGIGNEAYDLLLDDIDKAIPKLIELNEADAYELKLLMERK